MRGALMAEKWRAIPSYPEYEVSDHGRVRSYHKRGGGRQERPHLLQPSTHGQGYKQVGLSHGGTAQTWGIHRLVAWAFLGPQPKGYDCCHNDDDPANNHLSNLRYDTRRANVLDALRHGCYADQQKLTPSQVRQIRTLKGTGHTCRGLAKRFDVSRQLISEIARGIAYAHVE